MDNSRIRYIAMSENISIGIVGIGVVGGAFLQKCVAHNHTVYAYDTDRRTTQDYADTYPTVSCCTTLDDMLPHIQCVCVALPTRPSQAGYDLHAFSLALRALAEARFLHPIFIMSTVLPPTLNTFHTEYPTLQLFHIPEFLSSASAELDSLHPTQHFMLLGAPDTMSCAVSDRARMLLQSIIGTTQQVMVVKATESAACKVFCNAFYAVKVQLCNEFYNVCTQNHISYDTVRMLMLQNGWIHPMHTQVPGPDGRQSFGGNCLPKDLEALVQWTNRTSVACPILKATLDSRIVDDVEDADADEQV